MNIKPDSQKSQSISDDQELAKVLAGINGDVDGAENNAVVSDGVVPPTPMPAAPVATDDSDADASQPTADDTTPVVPSTPMPEYTPDPTAATAADDQLDSIKKEALGELRPLVDKLNVSPEEKFDTYLLLLRSTDDRELIAPAHDAARGIVDEARRAQALLDIIKEIDFLSQPKQQ